MYSSSKISYQISLISVDKVVVVVKGSDKLPDVNKTRKSVSF